CGRLAPLSYPYAVCQPLRSVTAYLRSRAVARRAARFSTSDMRSSSADMLPRATAMITTGPSTVITIAAYSLALIGTGVAILPYPADARGGYRAPAPHDAPLRPHRTRPDRPPARPARDALPGDRRHAPGGRPGLPGQGLVGAARAAVRCRRVHRREGVGHRPAPAAGVLSARASPAATSCAPAAGLGWPSTPSRSPASAPSTSPR